MDDYKLVAHEYYDKNAHPTCHNFLCLSRLFIADQLALWQPGDRVLEVGAGDSVAAAILYERGADLSALQVTDASKEMLSHSERWAKLGAAMRVAAASALPYADGSMDYVVASLADPYDCTAFWDSVRRLLTPSGRAIVTVPSFRWASAFRRADGDHHVLSAEFTLRDGSRVRMPSLVRPLADEVAMIEGSGLEVTVFRCLGADLLPSDVPASPKALVFQGGHSSLVWGFVAVKAQ